VGGNRSTLVDLGYMFEANHGDKWSVAGFTGSTADLGTVTAPVGLR